MTRAQARAALRELMERFDSLRAKWVRKYGTDDGFADWFTGQVLGPRKETP